MTPAETRTQVEGLLRSTYEDGTPIPDAMGLLHNLGLTHDRLVIDAALGALDDRDEALHRIDGLREGGVDADPYLTDAGETCARGRNCDRCVELAVEQEQINVANAERDFSECVDRLAVDDSCWIEHVSRGFDAVLGEAS